MSLPARLAALGLAAALLTGCSGDPHEEYCELVADNQDDLTRIVGESGDEGLLPALPIFNELADEAPRDLVDEWDRVVGPLSRLEEVLEAEDVDPAEYDPEKPPERLDDAAVARIEAAADRVAAPEAQNALEGIDQHARDVCQTPLSL